MNIAVDPIFLTTTLIKRFNKDGQRGTATGFFFTKNDKIWLITNKHVIYGDNFADENAQPEVNEFKLTLHVDRTDFRKNEEVSIPLHLKGTNNWLEHKKKC